MSKWIEIEVFVFPQDAYMAKSYLESEGIEVFLQDEVSSRVLNINGGVKLMVPEDRIHQAIELLEKGGFKR